MVTGLYRAISFFKQCKIKSKRHYSPENNQVSPHIPATAFVSLTENKQQCSRSPGKYPKCLFECDRLFYK